MVKLIRLQGDSDRSDSEIRNVFSEGILIPPNSQIGLRSCRVNFLSVEDLEFYRLLASQLRSFEFAIGGKTTIKTIVPVGDYPSINALLVAIQKATNSSWTPSAIPDQYNLPWNYEGCHGRWVTGNNNRTNFQLYEIQEIEPRFGRTDDQFIPFGDTAQLTGVTRGNGSLSADGTATVALDLRGLYNTPLINQHFSFILETVPVDGSLELNAKSQNALSTDNTIPWGFAIEDHEGTMRYKLRVNNITHTMLRVTPTDDDIIVIVKAGNRVALAIARDPDVAELMFESGVTPDPLDVFPTGPIPYLGDDELDPQLMTWNIKASNGTVFNMDTCQYQAIQNMGGLAGNTIANTLTMPQNDPLSSMLGFNDLVYTATGRPATIVSDQPALARSQFPGIMVRIAAPGLDLDTYAGTQDRQNQSLSFLDVIVPQSVASVSNLIYEPNNMAMLDLKNVNPIEMRNANIQFARDDTGVPLKFTGQPMVMLAINTSK